MAHTSTAPAKPNATPAQTSRRPLAANWSRSSSTSAPIRQNRVSHGSSSTVCAATTLPGKMARMPQARLTGIRPRCRTSRPTMRMPAELARTVRIRPTAMPQAVPVTWASSAAGVISRVMPGGCTMMKSRYGRAPCTSRSALPKYGPSSYWVTPSR